MINIGSETPRNTHIDSIRYSKSWVSGATNIMELQTPKPGTSICRSGHSTHVCG